MDENLPRCSTRAYPIFPKTASNRLVEQLLKKQERDERRKKTKKQRRPSKSYNNLTTQEMAIKRREEEKKRRREEEKKRTTSNIVGDSVVLLWCQQKSDNVMARFSRPTEFGLAPSLKYTHYDSAVNMTDITDGFAFGFASLQRWHVVVGR